MNDVVICLWARNGLDRAAEGVVGAGRGLAADLGAGLQAIVVGMPAEGLTDSLSKLVDKVVVLDAPALDEYQPETCLAVLAGICRDLGPRAVLLGGDVYSQELAPRLAHRLGGSSMADGVELSLDGDALLVKRSAYGGRAAAVYRLQRSPAVVWLRARAFAPAAADRAGEVVRSAVEVAAHSPTRIVERRLEKQDGVALEEARLVVAGGRGLGGPEPFEELKKLAAAMGAAIGASRVACDEGWVPPTWQIGQTGKKIAPELYLAVGISGAAQHLLGIADSKVIAAINTDPDAPIFKHCSFGLVEDYRKAVPALIEKLAQLGD